MPNILQLLKRRKTGTREEYVSVGDDGSVTVDLTISEDEDQQHVIVEEDERNAEELHHREVATEVEGEQIPCPICEVDLSCLQVSERESHVELCLLSPSRSTHVVVATRKQEKQGKHEKHEKRPRRPKKPLPDFKVLDLLAQKVIVDGFCYAPGPTDKYFLSHYHSDHYIGIVKSWSQGVIYTSEITGRLVMKHLRVPEDRIVMIPMHKKYEVCKGVWVTLEDANHCPGAVVFLFEASDGDTVKRILHTGDFRVSKALIDKFKDVYLDEIYLDTTYLDPRYSFYDQRLVINTTVDFVQQCVTTKQNGIIDFLKGGTEFVILVGSYSIGKEKVYTELAKRLKTKVFVAPKRYETLTLCGYDMSMFSKDDESSCMIHVVNFQKLVDRPWLKRFSNKNIIVIRPTGWTFTRLGRAKDTHEDHEVSDTFKSSLAMSFSEDSTSASDVFLQQLKSQWQRGHTLQIPYSEHSSFKELSLFCSILKWGNIIPTVNVNNHDYPQWFKVWKETTVDYAVVESHFNV